MVIIRIVSRAQRIIPRNVRYFAKTSGNAHNSTVDSDDVRRHSYLADDWWNPAGPMKALHSLNKIRVPFIRDGLIGTGRTDANLAQTASPLKGVDILEVGCGAGLLTEQLARIHANVTAIDPGEHVIKVAQDHLHNYPPNSFTKRITYQNQPIEGHIESNAGRYDAVIVSEVLEHVHDKSTFLTACTEALKPGGSIFLTTFNKTLASWIGGIVIAEQILRLVPPETHDWEKFIPPIQVQRILEDCGCSTILVNGFMYEFWRNDWRWTSSTDLSYALHAIKH